jgi:hypothetical protein
MPMSIQAIIATPSQNANQNAQNSAPAYGPAGGMPSGGSASPAMHGQSGGSSQGSSPQGSMGGNAQMPSAPTVSNSQSNAQPQITGNTKGVVGISNLSLSATPNSQQASVLTSEKNNVKLEGGTFMLLRVAQ